MPKSADSWGRPYGSTHDRRRVWTGTITILLGATAAAVAVVLLDLVWLWVAAAVLVIVGVVMLAVGRRAAPRDVPAERRPQERAGGRVSVAPAAGTPHLRARPRREGSG